MKCTLLSANLSHFYNLEKYLSDEIALLVNTSDIDDSDDDVDFTISGMEDEDDSETSEPEVEMSPKQSAPATPSRKIFWKNDE